MVKMDTPTISPETVDKLAKEFVADKKGKGRQPTIIAKRIKELNAMEKAERRKKHAPIEMEDFFKEFKKNGGSAFMAIKKLKPHYSIIYAQRVADIYLSKAKEMGLVHYYLNEKGFTFGKALEIAIEKAKTSKDPAYMDRLMKMAGWENFIDKKVSGNQTINVIQAQKKDAEDFGFIEGEIVDDKEKI